MITLEPTEYGIAKPFFSDILGAYWHLESMISRGMGAVVVDIFPNPNTVCLETPFCFYYFAGVYNQSFMESHIDRIVMRYIPAGETRPLFIFSPNQEWKTGIENYLKPYIHQVLGAYLTRRLLHLNIEKYEIAKSSFIIPNGYAFEVRAEDNSVSAVAIYGNNEVCKCNDGGRGLGCMDFDIFTHLEHRNKGLALQCCSLIIDYCIHNDLTPQWGCWTVNAPSCKLAEKLGL